MKKLISSVLVLSAFFFAGRVVFSAPTKGVQAVLLHRWSSGSTANLVEVLRDYPGTEIEISFAPNVAAPAGDPYKNLRFIIDALQGRKRVYAVVYLNFHAPGSTVNNLDKFQAFFNAYKDSAQIIVSPSLEDAATVSEVNAAARTIASGVGGGNISKLILRRSPDPTNNDQSRPARTVSVGGVNYSFKSVELEKHGIIEEAGGSTVYSNDGVFVYDPNMTLFGNVRETSAMFDSINTGTKYSIATFRSRTGGLRTNLWRPAYNMYRDCNGRYLARSSRTFSDCNSKAFDSGEANVLRRFLGML